MSDIALSSANQSVLLLLQRTASLTNQTNERLATGLKVNRAADDAPAFLLAQSLNARAGDLLALKDGIGQGASALGSALNGIDAISGLANQLKGIAAAARGGTAAERAAAAAQFDEFLSQIDNLRIGGRRRCFLGHSTAGGAYRLDIRGQITNGPGGLGRLRHRRRFPGRYPGSRTRRRRRPLGGLDRHIGP